ncbi:hypothetical protein AMAG_04851 [Allomyces macrogynus ATCC 38327]|uniref:CAP-Gly domain-containing protein n=1 Tax=Allomyces macrogynus (strain ATCC 38327) TaxID=578462 RepID=A0A0L0S6H1_ALLM3|nr:hypothetical protein AMAG_04851 [Allomyces macrogynus ATCC 38327]|eukprot:KNE58025.1 hypothetical protein AMAG_04851 [Allomyces macrogynus ATCC 38327]
MSSSSSDSIAVGTRVTCTSGHGTVRFIGSTTFATGRWVGVELDEQRGKNDGSVLGKRYFTCRPEYGLFLRASQVKPLDAVPTPSRVSRPSRVGASGTSTPTPGGSPRAANKRMSIIASTSAASLRSASTGPISRAATPAAAQPDLIDRPPSRMTAAAAIMDHANHPARQSPPVRRGSTPSNEIPPPVTVPPPSRTPSGPASAPATAPPARPTALASPVAARPATAPAREPSMPVRTATASPAVSAAIDAPSRADSPSTIISRVTSPASVPEPEPEPELEPPKPAAAAPEPTPVVVAQRPPPPGATPKAAPAPQPAAADESALAAADDDDDLDIEDMDDADIDAELRRLEEEEAAEQALLAEENALRAQLTNAVARAPAPDSLPPLPGSGLAAAPAAPAPAPPAPAATAPIVPIVPTVPVAAPIAKRAAVIRPETPGSPIEALPNGAIPPPSAWPAPPATPPSTTPVPLAPSTPIARGTTPGIPAGQQPAPITQKEYDELRFKLKGLEQKRQEDIQKLRDIDELRAAAESAAHARDKMADKLHEIQIEVRELRKQVKDLAEEKEELDFKVQEANDNLELVTLDKEMAEEKNEALQAELDAVKDKLEEVQLDLEVLQGEKELGEVEANEMAGDPTAILQLTRQNDRLKEALITLKESRDALEEDTTHRIKLLEKEVAQAADVKEQFRLTRERLSVAEETIEELRAALEDAAGAEDMVEELTEKNLQLNEKMDEMQRYLDDLEALKELNEELEENHILTERELSAELETREQEVQKLVLAVTKNEEALADYERTIQQFRELVKSLTRELEEMREKAGAEASPGADGIQQQSQEMLALNLKLQSHAMKVQAKTIDLELETLEANQAKEHVALLQAYLPDSFFVSEQDPIQSLLMIRRLEFKAHVLIKQTASATDALTNGPTNNRESLPGAGESLPKMELQHAFEWLRGSCRALAAHMETCTPEQFLAMGKIHQDLSGAEKRLDAFLDVLKQEGELRPSAVLPDLGRVNHQLDYLLTSNTQAAGANAAPTCTPYVMRQAQLVSLQGIDNLMTRAGVTVATMVAVPVFDGLIDPLTTNMNSTRAAVRKLARMLRENQGGPVASDSLMGLLGNAQLAVAYLKDLREHLTTANAEHDELDLPAVVANATLKHFDRTESLPLSHLVDLIKRTSTDAALLESATAQRALAAGDSVRNEPSVMPPWALRSDQLKRERPANVEMEKRVADLTDRLTAAVTQLRVKEEEVRELVVKCQLLESRQYQRETLALQQHTAQQVDELQRTIDTQRSELVNLNRFVDSLKEEASELEKVNRDLQRRLKAAESHNRHAAAPGTSGLGTLLPRQAPVAAAASQDALVAAVAHLRAENARLKARTLLKQLDDCKLPMVVERSTPSADDPIPKPFTIESVRRPFDADSSSNDDDPDADDEEDAMWAARGLAPDTRLKLRDVALEARSLQRRARELASSPRVVRVAPPPKAQDVKWTPLETRPAVQLARDRINARLLARKAAMLHASAARLTLAASPHAAAAAVTAGVRHGGLARARHERRLSASSTFSSFSFATQLTGIDKAPRIGTIRVPMVHSVVGGPRGAAAQAAAAAAAAPGLGEPVPGVKVACHLYSPAELERVHAVFVN